MSALAIGAFVLAMLLFSVDRPAAALGRTVPADIRAILDYVTDVGLLAWYFYPALLLTIGLLLAPAPEGRGAGLRRHRLGGHAGYALASLGLATTITHLLKWLLGRARPPLLDEEGVLGFALLRMGDTFESFPSGHSNNMGAVAIILAVWFPRWRWLFLAAGASLAVTRIAVEAHFPSDVVAGFAIGALTALALARYLAVRRIVYALPFEGRGWRGLLPRRQPLTGRADVSLRPSKRTKPQTL